MHVLADVLVGILPLESVSKAIVAKFLRRVQNRRRSILVPPASTSAYVKVLPKTMLAAGHRVIVLAYALVDVLVGNLPLESASKAIVAKFLRRAQNRRKSVKVGNWRSSGCGSFACEQTQQLILWFRSVRLTTHWPRNIHGEEILRRTWWRYVIFIVEMGRRLASTGERRKSVEIRCGMSRTSPFFRTDKGPF